MAIEARSGERGTKESPYLTPGIVLVDEHYRELGLTKGWNNDRLNRLCEMYRATPHEIGRLCCVYNQVSRTKQRAPFGLMQSMIRNDHFPPYVALHFAILERCYLEEAHGAVSEPVMPVDKLNAERGTGNAEQSNEK